MEQADWDNTHNDVAESNAIPQANLATFVSEPSSEQASAMESDISMERKTTDVASLNPAPSLPDNAPVTEKGAHIFYIAAFLARILCLFFCAFGAVIYGVSAYIHGSELISNGIARLLLGEIAGGTKMVSVYAATPYTADIPDTALPPLTNAESIPANKEENVIPLYTVSAKDRIVEDLSSRTANGLGIINETPYTPSLASLAEQALPIYSLAQLQAIHGEEAPIVLILHTHGTEGYLDSAENGYHTDNAEKSVIQLGKRLTELLTESGINTLHLQTAFDADQFDSAYYNASLAIRDALQKYPSISYILDIHRDAIESENSNGTVLGVAPCYTEDGQKYAQLMFVVGTDYGGSNHSGWQDNLTLAVHLQHRLTDAHPGLCRDINLRSASFNEQYTKGSLLIEVGAASSTLNEALRTIEFLADALIAEITG